MCVRFWLLAHLTLDLSQAEKKKMLLLAEQMPQMTTISLKIVEVVILSENQVLNGPIAKNQHKCRGPKECLNYTKLKKNQQVLQCMWWVYRQQIIFVFLSMYLDSFLQQYYQMQ